MMRTHKKYAELYSNIKFQDDLLKNKGLISIIDFDEISYDKYIPISFVRKFSDYLNWSSLSSYRKFSYSEYIEFKDKIILNYLMLNSNVGYDIIEDVLEKNKKRSKTIVNNIFENLSDNSKLSERFIEKYKNKLNWNSISSNSKLSEKFILKHIDKINFSNIGERSILSEEFIRKYAKKLNWYLVKYKDLSVDFLIEHKSYFDFSELPMFKDLSEDILDKYCNLWNWYYVACYQNFSLDFYKKHITDFGKNYIDYIAVNNKIPKEVQKQMFEFFKDHEDMI